MRYDMKEEDKRNVSRLTTFYKKLTDNTLDISTLQKRIILQKLVFLAKKTNKFRDFENYKFNLYLHGPYSTSLCLDSYLADANKETIEKYNFSEEEDRTIGVIKTNFKEEIKNSDASSFELYATVFHAIKNENKEKEQDIIEFVKENKPWFEKDEIKKAISKINTFLTELNN